MAISIATTIARVWCISTLLVCVSETTATSVEYDVPEFIARPKETIEPKQPIGMQMQQEMPSSLFGIASPYNKTEMVQEASQYNKTAHAKTTVKQCTSPHKSKTCDQAPHQPAVAMKHPAKTPQKAIPEPKVERKTVVASTHKKTRKDTAPVRKTRDAADDLDRLGVKMDSLELDFAAFSLQVVFAELLGHRIQGPVLKDEDTVKERVIKPFALFDEDGDGRIPFGRFRDLLTKEGMSTLTDQEVNHIQEAISDAMEHPRDCQVGIDEDGQIDYKCVAHALFL